MKDYIIVGFGFAGMAFSHLLQKHHKSFVVFSDQSQQATKVSGALYNPVVLKRFTSVWKAEEQMVLLRNFYREMEEKFGEKFTTQIPVLRKFASLEEQNNWFVASDKPVLHRYLSTKIRNSVSPSIESPFGLGEVLDTGRVFTEKLLHLYQKQLTQEGIFFPQKFNHNSLEIRENGVHYQGISARKIVFCEGFGVTENPFFSYLPLRGCKGELLSFSADDLQLSEVIKSNGFIFPDGENNYKIGATYQHHDLNNSPTEQGKTELLEKLNNLISCPYQITGQHAAIRPTSADRRPMIGQHPEYKSLFVLNGLGTRGSMLAPYTATTLLNFIENGQEIDPEMNISRFIKRWKLQQK